VAQAVWEMRGGAAAEYHRYKASMCDGDGESDDVQTAGCLLLLLLLLLPPAVC